MIKKILLIAVIAATSYACNNNETKTNGGGDTTAAAKTTPGASSTDASKNPDYQKGLALIGANDCLTCHKVDETSTGPAYRDVANKYTNDDATINKLADKIIKGGSGNWGSVPMTPHDGLSQDDAKALAKYVLLLKNK